MGDVGRSLVGSLFEWMGCAACDVDGQRKNGCIDNPMLPVVVNEKMDAKSSPRPAYLYHPSAPILNPDHFITFLPQMQLAHYLTSESNRIATRDMPSQSSAGPRDGRPKKRLMLTPGQVRITHPPPLSIEIRSHPGSPQITMICRSAPVPGLTWSRPAAQCRGPMAISQRSAGPG
jgi:hypothetical protein